MKQPIAPHIPHCPELYLRYMRPEEFTAYCKGLRAQQQARARFIAEQEQREAICRPPKENGEVWTEEQDQIVRAMPHDFGEFWDPVAVDQVAERCHRTRRAVQARWNTLRRAGKL